MAERCGFPKCPDPDRRNALTHADACSGCNVPDCHPWVEQRAKSAPDVTTPFERIAFHALADFTVLIGHDYATGEMVVELRDNGRPDMNGAAVGRAALLIDALRIAEEKAGYPTTREQEVR